MGIGDGDSCLMFIYLPGYCIEIVHPLYFWKMSISGDYRQWCEK